MSLEAARDETQRLRASLEQGHNPKIIRLLEKQAIYKADSIEALFRQWYEAYCKKNKKGHHEILRSFEIYAFPKFGKLPAEKVTLHEWLALLEELVKVKPGIAERILINAKQMYKWGVKRRLLAASPLLEINAKGDLQIKKVDFPRINGHLTGLVYKAIGSTYVHSIYCTQGKQDLRVYKKQTGRPRSKDDV